MSSQLFSQFRENLAVKNAESISTSYKRITKSLNKKFWNTDSEFSHCRQVGSYGRYTAINGVSDLDMIFELPWSLYSEVQGYSGNKQYKLLSKVCNALKDTYHNSDIRVDGQIVAVKFTKGHVIELVPAFKNIDGSYKFPDTNDGGKWRECDPVAEQDKMKEINDLKNRNLRTLCKMVRAWKNEHGVPLSGILIDTLGYHFIRSTNDYDNKSYASYKYMVRDFFSYLVDQDQDKEYWRAPGSGSHVYKKANFHPKAKKALRRCEEALEEEKPDKKWRSVFGRKFPLEIKLSEKAMDGNRSLAYANTEEFIDDKFPVNIKYELEIDCEINAEGLLREKLAKLFGYYQIPTGKSLSFYVKYNGVPKPVTYYWKVRNVGVWAESNNQIRGQIKQGNADGKLSERTSFQGDHFVECYAVLDGVCVARDRISVPI
ncbi:SMODS domain-containing nucleotidyltransferase [Halomonas sp. CSM-2]|uniref:SMODS domain-containing nucleotidyltransferase n=1 Tax=Halomonas sp. CSM-2 TaxID=1975722 RepID=UPI000A282BBB|nr:nucleotidyltransferase [Halomonas sp. CSM-2]